MIWFLFLIKICQCIQISVEKSVGIKIAGKTVIFSTVRPQLCAYCAKSFHIRNAISSQNIDTVCQSNVAKWHEPFARTFAFVPFVPNDSVSYIRFQVNWFKLKTHHPFEKLNECTHTACGDFYWSDWKSPAASMWAHKYTAMLLQKIYGAWIGRKRKKEREVMMVPQWFGDLTIKSAWDWNVRNCYGWRNHVESAQTVCVHTANLFCHSIAAKTLFASRNLHTWYVLRTHTFHTDNLTCEFSLFYFQIWFFDCLSFLEARDTHALFIHHDDPFLSKHINQQNWVKDQQSALSSWKHLIFFERCREETSMYSHGLRYSIRVSIACTLACIYSSHAKIVFLAFSKQCIDWIECNCVCRVVIVRVDFYFITHMCSYSFNRTHCAYL